MRPVPFIFFFTLGVSLMVLSGYVPRLASARSNGRNAVAGSDNTSHDERPFRRTLTRRVLAPRPGNVPAEWGEETESAREAYGDAPPEAASQFDEEPDASDVAAGDVTDALLDPADGAPEPSAELLPPETESSDSDDWPLFADAGPDRVVWIGWDELLLDGSASTGEKLSYQWRQTAGPVSLAIKNGGGAVTTASGLLLDEQPDWRGVVYEFELTVTDEVSDRDVDTVEYLVKWAPSLKIMPTPDRHFEFHDGYQLGHFDSWVTNLESYASAFEIASETELTFTKVAGGAYDLTGGKADGGHVYQIVVYGRSGEPASWVEFLVDTEDKVPGIVQLGVNWEGR